jgi:hypothetical protein
MCLVVDEPSEVYFQCMYRETVISESDLDEPIKAPS